MVKIAFLNCFITLDGGSMRTLKAKPHSFNKLPLTLALMACLYGPAAFAQSEAETDDEEEAEASTEVAEMERVTVTGSLLRRAEYDSASPIQVISADVSLDMGQLDTAQMLQSSSVAAGSTQINHQFSGFVVEGGTGVQTLSLRGLGANRTLVLLDGRRPGPSGTRGQVGAFDLNVIPQIILQRAEILKDGSSSIYGSDAVAGVVNLITRKSIDSPMFNVDMRVPLDGGGEVFSVSGATGWSFDRGDMVVAAEFYEHRPLLVSDRDFFSCPRDLVRDESGAFIDREDRSILAGTSLGGCNNLYANTVIDALTGLRYIPAPDGVTIGLIPGYRPRVNPTYANSPQAAYEDVLNFDFYGQQQVIDKQRRGSVYAATDFTFDSFNWYAKFLYNNRQTDARRFRQFFPLTGGNTAASPSFQYPNSPDFATPVPSGVAQPVMPFRSNQRVDIDYFYVATGLEGMLPTSRDWSWRADASYSYSDGNYDSLGIVANRSGDVRFDDDAPVLDYFSPGILSGENMDELQAQIGEWNGGNTIYDQFVVTGVLSGDVWDLPAGSLGAAIGVEYRDFSIDDQPSQLSQDGNLWGQSSAQVTKGSDSVSEVFGEIEIPLIAGKPGFEMLSFNASARAFDYDSVDGTDSVWKAGLSWQITPAFRMRATRGTSYRAPGLYELYLGNQTAFVGQLAIDPCIQWGESTNQFIRANCAAEGIPEDFAGGTSSATVITGGGAGVLNSERSTAFTGGLVFTPSFADFSVALDYFEYEVRDEIGQLGGGSILGGCYGAPVFPNTFCTLFDRNPGDHPTAPFAITTVRDSYLNINKQKVRGLDLISRYDTELSIGKLQIEGQATYVTEDIGLLFDSEQEDGFDTDDRNGSISRPKLTGNLRTSLQRGDFSYTWFTDYVHGTRALFTNPNAAYFGTPGVFDVRAESRMYHGASVRYTQGSWDLLFGIRNLFDQEPPRISSGVDTRYGTIPAFATQYDWYGRSAYLRFGYRF